MRARLLLTALAVLALAGCEEDDDYVPRSVCTPMLDSLDPDSGPTTGGTQVTLAGLWVATELGERDAAVHVGGAEAEVTGVFRGSGCTNCDLCIADALRCAECERVCRGQTTWTDPETGENLPPEACEEWVSFLTPPAEEPGAATVLITNSHGSADDITFLYEDEGIDDDDLIPDDDDVVDDDDSAADHDDDEDDDDSAR